ncbi:hypothetical protein [Streptomyces sp. NPDC088794]|uniref:hypothetical protein n=1 Tax=Streptomyces sp. NPDC088794 TaxID=3365902 RepID=UPI00381D7AF9
MLNDVLALLVAITALRVFVPDLRTGGRRLLRAGARVGVAELLRAAAARHADGQRAASTASQKPGD